MAAVQQAAQGHPGPMSRTHDDTPDELDQELDWLIEKEEEKETSPTSVLSSPPASPVDAEEPSKIKGLRQMDTHYPRSPSPRQSPRDQVQPHKEGISDGEKGSDAVQNNNDTTKVQKTDETANDEEDDSYENDDYEMSDDQKQAMMELQNMKLDLAYTVDEEPPEYDVTERVRQLNEELAKEPSPDNGRERAIKFKTDPVSLVVPPPDYTESEEEENQTQKETDSTEKDTKTMSDIGDQAKEVTVKKEKNDQERALDDDEDDEADRYDDDFGSPRSQESPKPVETPTEDDSQEQSKTSGTKERESKSGGDEWDSDTASVSSDKEKNSTTNSKTQAGSKESSSEEDNDEEKVLVERNGKFELLRGKDLTAEERIMYGVETEEDKQSAAVKDTASQVETVESKSSSDSFDYLPTPPVKPRPATASAASDRRKRVAAQNRAKSASQKPTHNSRDYNDFDYNSPYALDPAKRKEYQREYNERKKQEKDEEEQRKREKEKDQQDADDAFQAWLKNKRDASARRKREENEKKKAEEEQTRRDKNDENGDCSESANQRTSEGMGFSDWCEIKRGDKQKQRHEREAQRQEYDDGYSVRHRSECNKAFRQWLKKKNSDLRRQKVEDKQRYRVTRLLARRSRKSQQLARAMTHAQAFKYVDYYGYRY